MAMKNKEINVSDVSDDVATTSSSKSAVKKTEQTPLKQLISKLQKLSRPKQILLAVLLFVGLAAIPAYIIYEVVVYEPPADDSPTSNPIVDEDPEPIVEEPVLITSPVNGVQFEQDEYDEISQRRPVAVMINNHHQARPTYGLQEADIVFETPVESGITRHLAVYWSNAPERVGSIRSVRQYHLELLSPFDAIFVHDGYASGSDPRIDAGGNIYRYGIKAIATQGSWRDNIDGRFAPHNEFNSISSAMEIGESNGWTGLPTGFEAWEFDSLTNSESDSSPEPAEGGDMTEASIQFNTRLLNSGLYDVKWQYDSDSNEYMRLLGSVPDIDGETDKQIAAKVVIIQSVDVTPTYNEKAHIIVGVIGSGTAKILQNGQVIDANWVKDDRSDRTTFTTPDGDDIEFARGLIWVELVPTTEGAFDII